MNGVTLEQVDGLIAAAVAAWAEPVRALTLARRAKAESETMGPPDRVSRALLAEADANYFSRDTGGLAHSGATTTRACSLAAETGGSEQEIAALARLTRAAQLNSVTAVCLDSGDYVAARPLLSEGLRWARKGGGEKIEAILLSNMAVIHQGHLDEADAARAPGLVRTAMAGDRQRGAFPDLR